MEALVGFNLGMRYIEDHLADEEIDQRALAGIVGCSALHFTRMFSFVAGISLLEYIRRRRLTRAALELQQGKVKVIDLALKYGYDSPTAFNRAFQKLHGIAPREARKPGAVLQLWPPMSFHLSVQGGAELNYRVVDKPAFTVMGQRHRVQSAVTEEGCYQELAEIWTDIVGERLGQLAVLSNGVIPGILGFLSSEDGAQYDYTIGVTSDAQPPDSDCASTGLAASSWAIFESVGALPGAIARTAHNIFTEWFPFSGFECASTQCIGVFSMGDFFSPDYTCEVWVPVRRAATRKPGDGRDAVMAFRQGMVLTCEDISRSER